MRLLDNRRDKKVDGAFSAAAEAVAGIIDQGRGNEALVRELRACTAAACSAIPEFLAAVRPEGLDGFVTALDEGTDPSPPLRVAAWAYMKLIIRDNYWDRREQVQEMAERSYGIESEAERAVAQMETYKGTRDSASSTLRFDRIVYTSVIASVMGSHDDADLLFVVLWGDVFRQNWDVFRRAYEHFQGH